MTVSLTEFRGSGGGPEAASVPASRLRNLRAFWRTYRQNRGALVGLAVLLSLVIVALFADAIAPYPPFGLSRNSLEPPGSTHLFGTDDLGRDVLSGVIFGTRVSLAVGFAAAAVSTVLGIVIGMLAGFHGGWIDGALMRVSEFFQVVPRFFLALLVVSMVGPSVWNIAFVIGILGWPAVARLVRAQVLSLKEREFVQASTAVGASSGTLIVRHLLPNAVAPAIVAGSLDVAQAILLEAALSFLGVGDPNVMSWGTMLNNAQRFLRTAWWMSFFPGFAVFLTGLSVNLVGDGLNEAFNPRLRGSR